MPLSGQIHRDKTLENISVAYRSERLIADLLAPRVDVKHETDLYFVYAKNSLSLPETLRANGAVANQADWDVSTASYSLAEHALKHLVTDRDRSNADPAIKLDIDATEYLTEKILLRKEVDLANLVTTDGNWANETSLTSTLAWSANTTLSNPITFIDTATSVIALNSGKLPNTVVINDPTFRAAKEHTSIVDRVKYTSADSVTEAMLAKLFNVPRILVAGGIRNTAGEGLADSMGWIWTDMAFVAYIEPNPGLKKPSALYQFTKSEFGNPYKVKKWREEERNGDFVEVGTMYQHKVVASDCAYIIQNTIQ